MHACYNPQLSSSLTGYITRARNSSRFYALTLIINTISLLNGPQLDQLSTSSNPANLRARACSPPLAKCYGDETRGVYVRNLHEVRSSRNRLRAPGRSTIGPSFPLRSADLTTTPLAASLLSRSSISSAPQPIGRLVRLVNRLVGARPVKGTAPSRRAN